LRTAAAAGKDRQEMIGRAADRRPPEIGELAWMPGYKPVSAAWPAFGVAGAAGV